MLLKRCPKPGSPLAIVCRYKGGAAFIVIASNTAHIGVPLIRETYPTIPVLHIADCTAAKIVGAKAVRVGLLGTEPTMREEYLKQQLAKHGITTIVPDKEVPRPSWPTLIRRIP